MATSNVRSKHKCMFHKRWMDKYIFHNFTSNVWSKKNSACFMFHVSQSQCDISHAQWWIEKYMVHILIPTGNIWISFWLILECEKGKDLLVAKFEVWLWHSSYEHQYVKTTISTISSRLPAAPLCLRYGNAAKLVSATLHEQRNPLGGPALPRICTIPVDPVLKSVDILFREGGGGISNVASVYPCQWQVILHKLNSVTTRCNVGRWPCWEGARLK